MAVTNIDTSYNQQKGITYTVVTDTSADFTGVTNDTYFYNLGDNLPYYKNGSGTVISVFEEGGTDTNDYTTGTTLVGNTLYFDRTDSLSAYTADLSSIGGVTDGDKGDITVSSGGATWSIDNGVVNNPKIADDAVDNLKLSNMTQSTIKGRAAAAGTGDPTDLTAAQVRTIINVADGAQPKPTLTKTIYLEDPVASDFIPIFRTDVAITIQEAMGANVMNAGSVGIYLMWDTDLAGTGPIAIGSAVTTLNSTTETSVNIASDPTIPANTWVFLYIPTVTTQTNIVVDVRYTED